jgi:serine phosphatase RsbU (regulator of sigma subunit)
VHETIPDTPIYPRAAKATDTANPSTADVKEEGAPEFIPVANILLVDDEPANLLALEAVLAELHQNLVRANSGEEALRRLLQKDFALILMDVRMSGMSGFETAALIRSRPKSCSIPIIFFTAHENADLQEARGYSLGAVDYLVKPIVSDFLRAKVKVFVEIFQKSAQVKHQAALLQEHQRREHERQLAAALARAEIQRHRQERQVARQIQQRLFPRGPVQLAGFDLAGASWPADETGGDYYDFIPMTGGRLGIVIGDVCGHGLGPALLMSETRALLWGIVQTDQDLGSTLTVVNRILFRDTGGESFVTLFLGWLDLTTRALAYASAGHVAGHLLTASGRVRQQLKNTGPALGILPDATFTVCHAPSMEPGDVLLLVTDGVEEAMNSTNTEFGRERTLQAVRDAQQEPPQVMIDRLFDRVRAFSGHAPQQDDLTAVLVKANSSALT